GSAEVHLPLTPFSEGARRGAASVAPRSFFAAFPGTLFAAFRGHPAPIRRSPRSSAMRAVCTIVLIGFALPGALPSLSLAKEAPAVMVVARADQLDLLQPAGMTRPIRPQGVHGQDVLLRSAAAAACSPPSTPTACSSWEASRARRATCASSASK